MVSFIGKLFLVFYISELIIRYFLLNCLFKCDYFFFMIFVFFFLAVKGYVNNVLIEKFV